MEKKITHDRGDPAGGGAREELHAPPDAGEGHRPLPEAGQDAGARLAEGPPDADRRARLRDQRAQDRLPDRLPAVPAVPDHRHGGGQRPAVDGHDDAAAGDDLPAVQAPAVRPRGRLEPGRRLDREELPMTPDVVREIAGDAIRTFLMAAGPILLVSLVVGFLISLLQAVTQVQDFTLTFVPKILAVFACLLLFLPWMASVLIGFTTRIIENLPMYVR